MQPQVAGAKTPEPTLLVATDLQDHGEAVLPYARALALTLGAQIELLHVVPRPIDRPEAETPETRANLLDLVDREIDSERRELAGDAIPCRFEVLAGTDAADTIRKAADRIGASAIVVHPHPENAWGKTWRHSVTEGVLRRLTRPVLVVPAHWKPRPLLRSVVYAAHFRDDYPGLGLAQNIAETWGGSLTLLHVAPLHPMDDEDGIWEGCGQRIEGDYVVGLEELRNQEDRQLEAGPHGPVVEMAWCDDEAEGLGTFLSSRGVDLLVLPAEDAHRLEMLTGDHAMRCAPVPVLVVPELGGDTVRL